MANDHFYCVFLNNEKISEQISWRIDTCPRRLDQQTQSFMDQFTYFRLFLDFCHLSCTSWNFIRPLPPNLFILFPRFHYLCCLLKLFWFQQRSIWAVFSTCTLTLNLLFFPGFIPLERLFLKISKTHTLTHQGLEAHRRQKQLPVSLQTSPPLSLLNLLSALSLLLFPPPLSVPSLSQFFHFPWLHFTTLPRLEETALVIFSLSHLWMFIRLEDFSKCMGSKANAVFLHSFVLGSRFLGEIFQLQRVCVFLDAKVSNRLSAR